MWGDIEKMLTRGVLFEVDGRQYIKIDEAFWTSKTFSTTVTTAMDAEVNIEELDSYQRFEPKFFIKIKRLEESK